MTTTLCKQEANYDIMTNGTPYSNGDQLSDTEDAIPGTQTIVKTELRTDVEDGPVMDILINNVVCSFSVGCHLNLKAIAQNGVNVEYRRENGMLTMKLRKPYMTATIWSSGKITCTGATSESDAKQGARRVARIIQKLGYNTVVRRLRVVNVLGSCRMPFEIKINNFSQRYREAQYEPELHPGVTYKIKELKATLKIFSTGSITLTAPSVPNVQRAIEQVYPLVADFRKDFNAACEPDAKRRRLNGSPTVVAQSTPTPW